MGFNVQKYGRKVKSMPTETRQEPLCGDALGRLSGMPLIGF